MAAVNVPSIKDILSFEEIPLILEKCFSMDAFVMGHHVYKETWHPTVGEKLDTAIQLYSLKMSKTNMQSQFIKILPKFL